MVPKMSVVGLKSFMTNVRVRFPLLRNRKVSKKVRMASTVAREKTRGESRNCPKEN